MTTAQFAKSSCLFGGSLEEAPWRGARRDQMSPVPGSGWDASRGPWMLGPPKWEQLAQGHCRAGRSVRPSASRPGTGDVRTAHVRGWRLSRRRLALGTAPPTAHTSVPRCLRPSPASPCSLQISEPAPILLEASGPSLSPHPSSPHPLVPPTPQLPVSPVCGVRMCPSARRYLTLPRGRLVLPRALSPAKSPRSYSWESAIFSLSTWLLYSTLSHPQPLQK